MTTQHVSSFEIPQNNDKTAETFNDWMFQQYNNPSTVVPAFPAMNKNLFESEDSPSSSTWFEPLENILSSADSSSTGSPVSTTASLSEVKLEPKDDSFEFTLNKLLAEEKLKQETEMETETETDTLLNTDVKSVVAIPKRSKNPVSGRRQLTEHQKQAHNKIEKKYRININTKISKLQQIIPWLATEETTFSCQLDDNGKCPNKESASNIKKPRLNKSMILEKAIDYILYLQNNERLYEMEVMRLKSELSQYKS